MTAEDEVQVRRRYPSPLRAIKWLRETRGWNVKESKEFYDFYRKVHGRITYDFIFINIPLPDETLNEILIIDPGEAYPITEEDLDPVFIYKSKK